MKPSRTVAGIVGLLAAAGCRPEVVRPGPDVAGAPPPCCQVRPRGEETEVRRAPFVVSDVLGAPPMVITPRSHPRLGFPEHGSIAVGSVTEGYLVDGAELPLVGPHHRILFEQASRRTRFGTTELVQLVQDAAAAVAAEHPGAVLYVGNIAKGGGGDIPWSVSHNTGLDADLLFYLAPTDPAAPPLEPRTLVHVDRSGRCVELPDCRLDVARTWSLVAALVRLGGDQIQWLFVADPVRAQVLEHARRVGAPRDLVARAAAVLHQPAGALPHDDHIHVRLYCPRADLLDGCRNGGLVRAGMPVAEAELAERKAALRRLLRDPDPERRAGAVELLRLLGAREAGADIAALLEDEVPEVRAAALAAVSGLRLTAALPAVVGRLEREPEPPRRWEIVDAIGAMGGPAAVAALTAALEDPRCASRGGVPGAPSSSVQRRAAHALATMDAPEAVGPLVSAVGRFEDAGFRSQALRALRLLTNQDPAEKEPEAAAQAWSRWWQRHRRQGRDRWLVDGFRAAGYRVDRLDRRAAAALLDAIRDARPWVSRNARRALSGLAHVDPGSERWSQSDAFAYWKRWCTRHLGPRSCRTRP